MYDSKETLELRVVIMCNVFDGVRSLYIFVFLLLQELCILYISQGKVNMQRAIQFRSFQVKENFINGNNLCKF